MPKSYKFSLAIFTVVIFLFSCKNNESPVLSSEVEIVYENCTKDPKSVAIANKVMNAMGGKAKWDNLKYVSWTFFGSRNLLWDKQDGRVRIKSAIDSTLYLVDLETGEGKKITPAKTILHTDNQLAIDKAKSIWINDMYWLFMPFKLMDSGVNLKYLRQDTTRSGIISDVIELTFNDVGDTPDNKYEIFVDQSDNLVKQWNFFNRAHINEPSAVWPWDNYKSYNGLMLSADRSDKKGPSNVKIYDTMNDEAFTKIKGFKFPE